MIAAIIARLEAQVPALKLVAGAAEYAALKANPPRSRQPAAYVVLLRERPGDNDLVNAVRQRVAVEVGVILALGNLRDPRGEAAAADIETLRAAVRSALLGWAPVAGHDAMEAGEGVLLDLRDGVVWWQDGYRTAYFLSAT